MDLKSLKRTRASYKAKLTAFNEYLKLALSYDKLSSLHSFEMSNRLQKIKEMYNDFDTTQTNIELLTDVSEDEHKERRNFDNDYFSLVATAEDALSKNAVPAGQASSAGNDNASVAGFSTAVTGGPSLKLPTIHLPTFSGRYQDWLGFHDTFSSLIHNSANIPNINKFHYLRSSLTDSAALVIQSLNLSAENYNIAWKALCDRYHNERLLMNNHIQALFSVEPIARESSTAIHNIIDTINKNLRALTTLMLPVQYWDVLIIHMVFGKLDPVTSREWEEERNKIKGVPTLEQFIEFLKGRADLLETMEESRLDSRSKLRRHSDTPIRPTFVAHQSPRFLCPLCKENHAIYQCLKFKSYSIEMRIQKANELNLCLNCLRKGHNNYTCMLGPCKICSKRHNSLLHLEVKALMPPPNSEPKNDSNSKPEGENVTLSTIHKSQVLLSTVLIAVVDHHGRLHKVRALLDNGSTSSFITEKLHASLKIPCYNTSVSIQGLNKQNSQITSQCDINIQSLSDSGFTAKLNCFIVPQITQLLPTNKISCNSFNIPSHIHLADPTFHTPSEVQMLLGADIFWDVLCNNHISLGKHLPTLNETRLGWLVSGSIQTQHTNHTYHTNSNMQNNSSNNQCHTFNSFSAHAINTHNSNALSTVHCHFLNTDTELQTKLDRYFECESFSNPRSITKKDEDECERIFKQTTIRQPDGRFVVTIPLKRNPTCLGESHDLALARFLSLERRFHRDSIFKHKYKQFMEEYIQLGHMSEVTNSNSDEISYFLPHHGVLRDNSLTTKLRTVFDASARTTSGISLNDLQFIGPIVQDDLLSILIRFRQHKYIVTSDVEKMYRQLILNSSQRSLQQILWRSDPTEQIKIYKLNTVTYGTASAPYLATRCLAQLGYDCNDKTVSTTILHDMYVDDLVTGSDDASDLIETCRGVIKELTRAHFYLRKWRSNNSDILNQIHSNDKTSNDDLLIMKHDKIDKTLCLAWNCQSDQLLFLSSSYKDNQTSIHTKRSILSTIAQIFDPLGLINPCLLQAKVILQKLWITKSSWDDEISSEFQTLWDKFTKHINYLEHIRIPRHVICDFPVHIELHTFSDASMHAYATCVYLRSISKDGSVHVRLLIAKSRVAPFKKNMTIPRLELCGAVLASQLTNKVKSALRLTLHNETYWCDSTIVLGWIKMSKSKLKQFVFNRIQEIADNTNSSSWHHIPTDQNPADIGSRGLNAQQLQNNSLWWSGPSFLSHRIIQKPTSPEYLSHNLPETKLHCHLSLGDTNDNSFVFKYSNFPKIQRCVAYLQRFLFNCRNPHNKFTNHLQISELNNSTTTLCKLIQREVFSKQRYLLEAKETLSPKDKLLSLNPFMDTNGLIRVGGRLSNSNYDFDTKHPILLHANHYVTELLFKHYHQVLMHAGPQLLLATIRQKFWVVSGRNLARKTARNCITCCRFSGKIIQPIMGNLPKERLQAEFPFYNSSVDYGGPIMIANKKGRGCRLIKAYICVFVCLAVRAVHIELVTELSTDCFLAALNRFIARRGRPVNIFSDNGTNFVGACNELSKFLKSKSDEISSLAINNHIKFNFSPAYSPHFNGLAEGSIKSVKHHLKRVLGLANLTYEEMLTVLTQIESILNSRPLTPMSSDPSDLVALTPSHFLIGRTLTMLSDPQDLEQVQNINALTRYKRIQCLRAHFWRRYHTELISELQKRNKWRRQDGELRLDQLVLIKDDRLPPTRWLLGRVTRLYPGTDGITRVADVYTASGTMRRAFNRLVPLPQLEHDVPRPAGCERSE